MPTGVVDRDALGMAPPQVGVLSPGRREVPRHGVTRRRTQGARLLRPGAPELPDPTGPLTPCVEPWAEVTVRACPVSVSTRSDPSRSVRARAARHVARPSVP